MDEPVSLVLLLLLCCCFGNGLVTDKSVIEITFTDAEGARQTSEMIGTFSRYGVVANVEGKLFHMGEDCDRKLPSDEQLVLVMTQTCEAVIATVINVRAVIIDYHSDQLEERLGSLHISLPIVLLHKRFNEISTSSDAYVVVKSSSMVFPTKHKEREYFDIGIFMAFFIMVSLICMVVLIKIKWRQRRKKISRKKCAQKLLQMMEVREYTGEEKPFSIKNCAVCLEELRIGNDVRVLPCQHEFHVACVDPWLLENYTCPLCCYRILDLKADTKKSRCLLNCFRNRNRYSSDDVEDPVLHCEQDVIHCESAVMHCERVNSPLMHSEREKSPLMHSERGVTKKPVSQKDEPTQYYKTSTRLSHNIQKHETCVTIDNKIEKPVSTKIMHVCKSRTPAKQNSQIISSSVIDTKSTQNNNAKRIERSNDKLDKKSPNTVCHSNSL